MYSFMDVSQDLTILSDAGLAWTVEKNGEILAIAGLAPQWTGRAIAWALISEDAGKCFHSIHKAVKRFLDSSEFLRIEANVDMEFEAGHRWMELLGFQLEGFMRAYRPDGADMFLYARIKPWRS